MAPGDPYGAPNAAALGAASDIWAIGPQTVEWGSWIYEMPDGSYSYTPPRTDNEKDHLSPGRKSQCPGVPFADYHSHWPMKKRRYNEFSDDDKWSNYGDQVPGYLVKPGGKVDIYVPPPVWEAPPTMFDPNTMGYTAPVNY